MLYAGEDVRDRYDSHKQYGGNRIPNRVQKDKDGSTCQNRSLILLLGRCSILRKAYAKRHVEPQLKFLT